jgi:hypothetical protein
MLFALLAFAQSSAIHASSMLGFVGSSIPLQDVNLSDNRIEPAWVDVDFYQDLPELGPSGQVKFANNGTHVFSLFTTTIDQKWVSVEFDAKDASCMSPDNDGWTFYIDETTKQIEGQDNSWVGTVYPNVDAQNDLRYEAVITDDLVEIEVVRSFDTGDLTGKDVVLANNSLVYLMFASQGDHKSTRDIYYLSIQVSDTVGIEGLNIIEGTDWVQLKNIFLYLGLFGVMMFVSAHYTVRGITRPLKKGSRIVEDSEWKPPTFKERLHDLTKPSNGKEKPNVDDRVKTKRGW